MKTMTFLGTGDAFNAAGALHSNYLLTGSTQKLLLECGPSVLAALKRQHIDSASVNFLLISHLHGDHFGGLPFVFLEYSYRIKRQTPLIIAGPQGIKDRANQLYQIMYGKSVTDLCFEVEFREVQPEADFSLGDFFIHPFQVPHNATPYALGYRIKEGGHSLVFSGDSAFCDVLIEKSQNVDLFICECCTVEPRLKQHVSLREINDGLARLSCKTLILSHLGEEMRVHSDTHLTKAFDGMIYDFGQKSTR